jgi:hypothetical protein
MAEVPDDRPTVPDIIAQLSEMAEEMRKLSEPYNSGGLAA